MHCVSIYRTYPTQGGHGGPLLHVWLPNAFENGHRATLLAKHSLCYNPSDSEEVIQLFAYLNIVQIIVSALLIVAILLQSKGEGFSGTFSADTSVFRTRRGVEKTLFQFTIGLAVVFILLSIISVLAASGVSTSSGVPTP